MKIVRLLIGLIVLLYSLSCYPNHLIALILTLISGLLIIPQTAKLIFDKIEFSKKWKTKLLYIGSYILAFFTIGLTETNIGLVKLEKIYSIDKEFENIEDMIEQNGIDSAKNFIHRMNIVYQDNRTELKTDKQKAFADELKIVTSNESVRKAIEELNDEEYSLFEKGELDSAFVTNKSLNKIFLNAMSENIKTAKDFNSESEYLIFRAKRDLGKNDKQGAVDYYNKAVKRKKRGDLKLEDYKEFIKLLKITDGNSKVLEINKIALKEFPEDYDLNLNIGKAYMDLEKYNSAKIYFKNCIGINDSLSTAYNNLGVCYANLKNKSKAIKYLKKAIKIEGNGGIACKNLREVTRKIASWIRYSECCDGTTSYSTESGACSHHGGVCKKMKRAVYEYTMECK